MSIQVDRDVDSTATVELIKLCSQVGFGKISFISPEPIDSTDDDGLPAAEAVQKK